MRSPLLNLNATTFLSSLSSPPAKKIASCPKLKREIPLEIAIYLKLSNSSHLIDIKGDSKSTSL